MKHAKPEHIIHKLMQKTKPAYDTAEDGMCIAYTPPTTESPECMITISYRNRYPTREEEDQVIETLKAVTWKHYQKHVAICKREGQLHKHIRGSEKQWTGYTRITYKLATQLTLL